MKKSIEHLEKELEWFANLEAHESKAAAIAGLVTLHAVREFNESSTKLACWMLALTVATGVLTLVQIVIAAMRLAR